ncbi:Uncharacterized protein APZ42_017248 [Daphnia magna]|uniref:Uncharacterized protein n=1 Tax=Daphnia magna TaxID=35525 RepID=A0A0P6FA19_9CRUS|nr:Uncharacterized protein APZ42_017248 [Daphnia magna]
MVPVFSLRVQNLWEICAIAVINGISKLTGFHSFLQQEANRTRKAPPQIPVQTKSGMKVASLTASAAICVGSVGTKRL